MKKAISIILLFTLLTLTIMGCSERSSAKEISFAEAGWDSIKFHNAVAGIIAEEIFGYSWREVPGSTTVLHEGLLKNEIDVHMEIWTNNLATYDDDLAAGKLQEVSTNFDDNYQGFYVPRYVIEGDPERGIEPMAPDLKYVWDLKKYPDVFPDDEEQGIGRIYGAIPGWEVDEILHKKYLHYDLDKNFIYFRPGSEAALATAITSAYEKGEPIAAYYWEPTWLLGMYDMVLLEDEPFNEETYKEGKTELPAVKVTVGTSNNFAENNPEIVEFLSNYKTSSALTSKALAHMQSSGANYIETAKWFLREHDELLDEWLKPEQAQTMRSFLNKHEKVSLNTNWLFDFPFVYNVDTSAIDDSVRDFSLKHDKFFNGFRAFLGNFVTSVHSILKLIPWFILILFVFFISWKVSGKISKGILYAILLFFIGVVGLWELMYETLSIVIVSVIISLALGFPLGILVSTSEKANKIVRPILDTMQTMPVFVYLIPAMLFFGLGKPPAVIATTIYAIVPIIRLTSHGIRQIDSEIIEASLAFGSTSFQSLVKVQIPQALPTIMAGVNQTIMMAMSMVVTTSMIGATGLGMEVLIGVNRVEIGRGLVSGTAVVIIAVILDRITQGLIHHSEVKFDGE